MVAALTELLPPDGNSSNPNISSDLGEHALDLYGPTNFVWPPGDLLATAHPSIASGRSTISQGTMLLSFFDDYYERIHVTPRALDLGNLVPPVTITVEVWNAYLTGQALAAITAPAGIDIIPVAPLTFGALQSRTFDVTISATGPALFDGSIVFDWTGIADSLVPISGSRVVPWPVPPDWSEEIDEELAWLTDVQRGVNGEEARLPLREAPRRTWEFSVLEGRRERRVLENVLYDWRSRIWALPVWTDVNWLSVAVTLGATALPVDPTDLDYRVGGLAMIWSDVQQLEIVEVQGLAGGQIQLARPTTKAWSPGARVFPCRLAYLTDTPEIARRNDRVISSRARFEAAEPCDWPAIAPAATYLGFPVLEDRPEESEDPTSATDRDIEFIDGAVGLVEIDDISGLSFLRQSHAWLLSGRADRASHRSLLYWLDGRASLLWLPTWADDLELTEAATDVTMTVVHAGISTSLRQQPGRRHIRIELVDGAVLYRQVSSSAELDATRESVLLTSTLGMTIQPGQVSRISWMMLARLDADRVPIRHTHESQGIARVGVTFVGAVAEEP